MVTPDIVRLSPNYNNRPPRGGVVIIHATRSTVSMNPSEFEGTLNYFSDRNSEASSHWVIARDGRKARVVPDNLQAWHAAEDNAIAWGIELEQGVESDGFPLMQMESLIEVSRDYVAMGVPAQRIYTTSAKGFVGHQDTAQGKRLGKSDPGSGFMWTAFIAALEEDDMAKPYFIGRESRTGAIYITDSISKWAVPDEDIKNELVKKGLVASHDITWLSDKLFNLIPAISDTHADGASAEEVAAEFGRRLVA